MQEAEKPTQPGEQRPIAGSQRRAGHLTAEQRHFVAEHDDFNRQFMVITPKESEYLESPDKRKVEEGQRHALASPRASRPRKSS